VGVYEGVGVDEGMEMGEGVRVDEAWEHEGVGVDEGVGVMAKVSDTTICHMPYFSSNLRCTLSLATTSLLPLAFLFVIITLSHPFLYRCSHTFSCHH
jgi:hypothetical protein